MCMNHTPQIKTKSKKKLRKKTNERTEKELKSYKRYVYKKFIKTCCTIFEEKKNMLVIYVRSLYVRMVHSIT